jgi:hypothetical protein
MRSANISGGSFTWESAEINRSCDIGPALLRSAARRRAENQHRKD